MKLMKKKKNGFTLIELIAVLVILAIIALIVTPLVMNIVKKAKDSANKRSVDAYGKAVELAVTTYLLDNGDYPTDISSLTIEYSGNEVVCNTQTLNEDGSIYLSGCSVNGVEVTGYTYGKLEETSISYDYEVGDIVTYNDVQYYVIKNSATTDSTVTLLKATPLTTDEVNTYGGVGTDNNHVNMHSTFDTTESYYQKAYDNNGYGGMAYYSSETCGYSGSTGCITDYESSEVKYVIDAWATDKLIQSDLSKDSLGYTARLITYDEFENLGYEWGNYSPSDIGWGKTENTPSWVYNSQYSYWTMSQYEDSASGVWIVHSNGYVSGCDVNYGNSSVVRPVITLLKSSI